METGCSLKRHSWDATPMTQEVIDEVLECVKNENSPDGMIICYLHGNVNHNEFKCDDIKGVCDCDTQHNLKKTDVKHPKEIKMSDGFRRTQKEIK